MFIFNLIDSAKKTESKRKISEKELSPKWESSEKWHTPFKCNLAKWSLISKNARELEKASQQNIHFRLIIVFRSAIVGSSKEFDAENNTILFLSLFLISGIFVSWWRSIQMYSEEKTFHSCQLRLSIRTYRPKHFAFHTLPKKNQIWNFSIGVFGK